MAVRDDRSDVKQTTAGFRGPLMVQSLTSAKKQIPIPMELQTYFYLQKTKTIGNPICLGL